MDLIILILLMLFASVLGIQTGITMFAQDLKFQNRMNDSEFEYVTSWDYVWTLLSLKQDDTE